MKSAAAPRRSGPGLAKLLGESLFLGTLGFGGGLSVLALIQSRAVVRHRWLTEQEFNSAAAVSQMLPGGAAANALAVIGLRFRGLAGAATAYLGFCVPGFAAVLLLAKAYDHVGTTPLVESVLGGVNAAVVGIIASITVRMLAHGVSRTWQIGVMIGAIALSLAGASPIEAALLGIVSGLAIDLSLTRARARRIARGLPPRVTAEPEPENDPAPELSEPLPVRPGPRVQAVALPVVLAVAAVALANHRLLALAFVFFRVGLGSYGGGFGVIPHLQAVMLEHGWLGPREFADAVALGKLTPGPVLLMATFIGYRMGGLITATVATLSILAGPWLLVVGVGSAIERSRRRPAVRAALRGLTPAVVGLMAASAMTLGRSLDGTLEIGIAVASALALIRFPINPAWVLVLASAARVAAHLLGA